MTTWTRKEVMRQRTKLGAQLEFVARERRLLAAPSYSPLPYTRAAWQAVLDLRERLCTEALAELPSL